MDPHRPMKTNDGHLPPFLFRSLTENFLYKILYSSMGKKLSTVHVRLYWSLK